MAAWTAPAVKAIQDIPYEMDLNALAALAWDIAEESGWHGGSMAAAPGDVQTIARLGLVCSEAGEAMDEARKGDEVALAFELADIIIRTLELAACLGIDLDEAVVQKMQKNRERLDVPARAGGKSI